MTSPLILCSILAAREEKIQNSYLASTKSYARLFLSILITLYPPKKAPPLSERHFTANLPLELIKKIVISPTFKNSKDAFAYLNKLSLISSAFPVQEARLHYANTGALTIPFDRLHQFLGSSSKELNHLSLRDFSSFEVKFTQLTSLFISHSSITSTDIDTLLRMPKLKKLTMENCEKIPDTSWSFPPTTVVLEELYLIKFNNLKNLCTFKLISLTDLKKFTLMSLPIKKLPPFNSLMNLTHLVIANLPVEQLPPLNNLLQLKKFTVFNCPNLIKLPSLKYLIKLQSLKICLCAQITTFPSIRSLISLRKLTILECHNLIKAPKDTELSRLIKVNIDLYHPLPSLLPENEDQLFNWYCALKFLF